MQLRLLTETEEADVALQSAKIVPDGCRQLRRDTWNQKFQGVGVALQRALAVAGILRDQRDILLRARMTLPIAQSQALRGGRCEEYGVRGAPCGREHWRQRTPQQGQPLALKADVLRLVAQDLRAQFAQQR